jgi:hypothetical protein
MMAAYKSTHPPSPTTFLPSSPPSMPPFRPPARR